MNNRVLQVREARCLNQEEFAKRLGVTKSAISGYETGRRKPTEQIIKAICREFSIDENWLRSGEGDMELEEAADVLEEAFRLYECNNFEKHFIRAYLEELTLDERARYTSYLNRVLGIAFDNMRRENLDPLASANPAPVTTDYPFRSIDTDNETAACEAAYREALGIAQNMESTASNTIEGTEETRRKSGT